MWPNALYAIALMLLSPVVAYRMFRHGRYRRGAPQKLFGLSVSEARVLTQGRPCMWIHAVSVGEVNLLPSIVAELERFDPETRVIISTSTDTGYDLAVQRFGTDRVFFCPLDFTWAARRTLKHLSPKQLILAELELWPNLIRIATENGVTVSVINARLSERSASRYQQFAKFLAPTFARLSWVGCQDETTRDRFAACGTATKRLSVTGSLKYDNAPTTRDTDSVAKLANWAGVDPWHQIWIVGSTQSGEEAMAINIYQSLRVNHPELRLVIVPRHKERFDEVATLIQDVGLAAHRRSCGPSSGLASWNNDTVILVDTIGELRDWWGVGQIATVGGSFGDRGGQNMLEPAGYGSAVSFGPNTRNFRQIAGDLIDAEAAVRVHDQTELEAFVRRCLDDIPAADALGRAAKAVVKKHRGAIKRTVNSILARQDDAANRRAA
ncbi:3-deoxy-D-manno-octulosonic acid transferase [Rubripirellula reticaptiva]|uniref:3-deoxy-D-manno-octulosonic acid transferase n=1 Tax=Rubripirellula reticaptiva TaxID=2528013 RepID=A0A5C6ELZ6_9BACT|nr:3-deoxy-D-manno-octulosonic acid transferase [Rubripirellula reticaptiva]TWU49374.1 3-deoxy-D-manno-octulosonic acid transferase [Rubripirellula reticaptiva]